MIFQVGDGPRCYAVWLDHWPVFLDGLDGLPQIGDRFEIDGQLWRVVAWTDRTTGEDILFDSLVFSCSGVFTQGQ